MKFVATEDIVAPAEKVWAQLSDFDRFEVRAKSSVSDLTRVPPGPAGEGTTWRGVAEVMGKRRSVVIKLDRVESPRLLSATADAEGMDVVLVAEIEPLGPTMTRLTVTTEARGRSFASRVMLQSIGLAHKQLAQRYKGRVADFAGRIERAA
ncbi:Polyketide cyclase / dehydrase and lipid transport [Jannaschia seosinensis]|uniref:Polyketide cyclase / dehydrase and lipid transport n=1 Tax=Jannaschia seosinensis TaxID=313367 RepID=A0A0M7BBF4_9RHOB|nr:SRPBCC family protein [Jannaschia seosinensis]CUH38250.1 Polyketide cyclase / dehydrase and lipid transport [Jannaschia seosinensis]